MRPDGRRWKGKMGLDLKRVKGVGEKMELNGAGL